GRRTRCCGRARRLARRARRRCAAARSRHPARPAPRPRPTSGRSRRAGARRCAAPAPCEPRVPGAARARAPRARGRAGRTARARSCPPSAPRSLCRARRRPRAHVPPRPPRPTPTSCRDRSGRRRRARRAPPVRRPRPGSRSRPMRSSGCEGRYAHAEGKGFAGGPVAAPSRLPGWQHGEMTPDDPPAADPSRSAADGSAQPLAERGSSGSQRPDSKAFREFITSGWGERAPPAASPSAAAPFTAARRAKLSALFPGERLVIPAGGLKVRSNDTDYRFRPHSAFAHLTGLGKDEEPDAVLVLHPEGEGHRAVLYLRPLASRETTEFYSDARYGEFWVGARPTLEEIATVTGIETADLARLADELAKDVGDGGVRVRIVPGADTALEEVVDEIRRTEAAGELDAGLAEALSELRLVKDEHEVAQMREVVARTIEGFESIVRALPRAVGHARGERVIETTFDAHARLEGNTVGYETIAAAGEHATTLHWIRNDGQ